MYKNISGTALFLFFTICSFGQDIISPDFEKRLQQLLNEETPVISVDKLYSDSINEFIILDSREIEEFLTSHIPGAIHVGYNNFSSDHLSKLDRSTPIVVYCSVGYRSEKITEKLLAQGYKEVYNLIGSIFEWANRDYPLVNLEGPVSVVHTYNKKWSRWVSNPRIRKVW